MIACSAHAFNRDACHNCQQIRAAYERGRDNALAAQFNCCGGNDAEPQDHTADCSRYAWREHYDDLKRAHDANAWSRGQILQRRDELIALVRDLIDKADVPDVLATDEWRELVMRAKAVTNG